MADVREERSCRCALRSEARWRCDARYSSRVQSRGGSDTPAPPARTKCILQHEVSIGCELKAERSPDNEL